MGIIRRKVNLAEEIYKNLSAYGLHNLRGAEERGYYDYNWRELWTNGRWTYSGEHRTIDGYAVDRLFDLNFKFKSIFFMATTSSIPTADDETCFYDIVAAYSTLRPDMFLDDNETGSYVGKHVGFIAGYDGILYASVGNGTTQTKVSLGMSWWDFVSADATVVDPPLKHKLEIMYYGAGSARRVQFYVDNVLKATISGGLPTGGLGIAVEDGVEAPASHAIALICDGFDSTLKMVARIYNFAHYVRVTKELL
ncbi:MAG: hypothetical protein PHZ19_07635 [Candidatus Thermoplasmatota archaeon]|jgi:hypothetical protein|nr:hypothetical protein [Candidatus Thermoplasmatota archaeon]